MRIDLNAKTTNLPETKGSPRATAAHPPAREPFGEDAATLAGGARLHQLEKQISQLPDERADRIEALTRAVRTGQYRSIRNRLRSPWWPRCRDVQFCGGE